MRILVDTSVLFSTLLFPHSVPVQALLDVVRNYEMVLCQQNVDELREIVDRKAPRLIGAVDDLLAELAYDLVPMNCEKSDVAMRDAKDQPILDAAISADIDVILTGDKDFLSLQLERPKCMTASGYLSTYKTLYKEGL